MIAKRYLGDGAYVEFDGFALILTAENGVAVTERIVLEPEIWAALVNFVDDLKKEVEAAAAAKENLECSRCGHTHQGKALAYICIGCPCAWRPSGPEAAG